MLYGKKMFGNLRQHTFVDSSKFRREGFIEHPLDERNTPKGGRSRGNRRRRLGAATVELAIVAPFIFFIIFGSVEFARMMMVKQTLTNAAREGCRHASLATVRDHESAEMVVRKLLKGTIADDQASSTVRVTITPEFHHSPESGTMIQAFVEVDCADISWLPATLFAGAKVRGVASMNRE